MGSKAILEQRCGPTLVFLKHLFLWGSLGSPVAVSRTAVSLGVLNLPGGSCRSDFGTQAICTEAEKPKYLQKQVIRGENLTLPAISVPYLRALEGWVQPAPWQHKGMSLCAANRRGKLLVLQADLRGKGPQFQSLFICWFIYKLLKMYKVIFGAGSGACISPLPSAWSD